MSAQVRQPIMLIGREMAGRTTGQNSSAASGAPLMRRQKTAFCLWRAFLRFTKPAGFKRFSSPVDPSGFVFRSTQDAGHDRRMVWSAAREMNLASGCCRTPTSLSPLVRKRVRTHQRSSRWRTSLMIIGATKLQSQYTKRLTHADLGMASYL